MAAGLRIRSDIGAAGEDAHALGVYAAELLAQVLREDLETVGKLPGAGLGEALLAADQVYELCARGSLSTEGIARCAFKGVTCREGVINLR